MCDERRIGNHILYKNQPITRTTRKGSKKNTEEHTTRGYKEYQKSEIRPLNLENTSIIQKTLHNLLNRLRQPHTNQRIPNLRMSMSLSKLEETTRDLRRELPEKLVKTLTPPNHKRETKHAPSSQYTQHTDTQQL